MFNCSQVEGFVIKIDFNLKLRIEIFYLLLELLFTFNLFFFTINIQADEKNSLFNIACSVYKRVLQADFDIYIYIYKKILKEYHDP